MIHSLQTRLLLTVGVIAVSAVAAVTIGARQGARQEFFRFRELERSLTSSRLPALAGGLAGTLDGRCCDPSTLAAAAASLPADAGLLVVETGSGGLVASAGPAVADLRQLTARRAGDVLTVAATRRGRDGNQQIALQLMHDAPRVRLSDGREAWVYVLAFPSEDRDRETRAFLGSLDRRMLIAAGVVGLLTLVVTWAMARSVVSPLDDLRAATRDLADGGVDRRVVPRGGREVSELCQAFNAMAGELGRQQALRRDLVRDVAHELRTPLTALRCRLEILLDGLAPDPAQAVRDLHEEVLHLGRLADDLQDLAQAEARDLRVEVTDVRLAEIVTSAVRAAGLELDARVKADVPDSLVAHGDVVRVRQVVLNLLTNAERYTPPNGVVTLTARRDGSDVIVEVRNTGSRLDPDQVSRIFHRFYRTDPSRQRVTGGTGLGLAIVKHLVEAQGGRVWARSDEDSVTVGFALPIA